MSVQTSANGESAGDQSTIPPTSLAQMGGPKVEDSVNAFRGMVSFPLHLVSLTARNGLHVDIALLYQGNVEWSRNVWNLSAPTGLVGLGWSLGFDMVVLDETQSASGGEGIYYLVAEGTPVRLYRISRPAADASVDESAAGDADRWMFEAEHHPFWRVCYSRLREAWEVTLEDGTVKTFGGTADSLQYGVKWGNWSGPTRVTRGQDQVPIVWNQSSVASSWGDRIDFEYTGFDDDAMPIGPSGKTYSRASYVKSIKTDLGRSLQFEYGQKARSDKAREFMAPHAAPPGVEFRAFQQRYETRYLKAIYALHDDGQAPRDETPRALVSVHFDYVLRNYSDDSSNPDLVKRYLSAVTLRNAEGEANPAYEFHYYGDPGDGTNAADQAAEDPARGALRSIDFPEGKRVTYFYESATLPGSSLSRELDEDDTGTGVPRVWITETYVLIVRYDQGRGRLTISVCSWNGAWCVQRVLGQDIDGSLDLDSVRVGFAVDCFAFAYASNPERGPREFRVFAFHRTFGEYGSWTQRTLAPLEVSHEDDEAELVVGTDFIVAVVSGGRELRRAIWDPRGHCWDDCSLPLAEAASYSIAAFSNYYVLAHYDARVASCVLTLSYFNHVTRNWCDVQLDVLKPIVWSKQLPKLSWSTGRVFAAATYIRSVDGEDIGYQIVRYQWDEHFRSVRPEPLNPHPVAKDSALPYMLTPIASSVIGNLGYVCRFNGDSWATETIAYTPSSGKPPRFAYGEDLVVLSSARDTVVYGYDAYADRWRNLGSILKGRQGPFTPSIAERYVTVEDQLYVLDARGELVEQGALGPDVEAPNVANHGPSYIAYEDPRKNTHIIFLENGGTLGRPVILEEQLFPAKGAVPGTILTGPDSFVTYRERDFDDARVLTIYKVLRGRVRGAVPHVRVSRVSIDDGFSQRSLSYAYEGVATTGPRGLATQYSRIRVVDGSDDPKQRPFGSTLLEYHNGQIQPPTDVPYYSLLNGNPSSISVFDENDRLLSKTQLDWAVFLTRGMPDGSTERLFGAFVRQRSTTKSVFAVPVSIGDGIESSGHETYEVSQHTAYSYADINGSVRAKVTHSYDSKGDVERIVTENLFGCEVYPGMRSANLLTATVQTTTRVNDAITSRSAIVWTDDTIGVHGNAVWSPRRTYHARSATANLTEDQWTGRVRPDADDWLLASEVVARNPHGAPIASRDADGVIDSILYDAAGWQPIARIHNGRINGDRADATYVGFEQYESYDGWIFSDGTPLTESLVNGDSHTGQRSLRLGGEPLRTLTRQLSPSRPAQAFILCGWLKTEPGFESATGTSEWRVLITPQGGSHAVVTVPITGTCARWRYFAAVVDVCALTNLAPATDPAASITIQATNTKATAGVLIDHVYFGPKLGLFSANVYDPVTRMETASVAPDENVQYWLYDRYLQEAARIGPGGSVTAVSVRSRWRERPAARRDGIDLNSLCVVAARGGGVSERFSDGDQWRKRWSAGSASWQVSRGALVHHRSVDEEAIIFEPSAEFQHYSVYLHATPAQDSADRRVGFRIGSSCEVAWSKKSGWTLDIGGESEAEEAVRSNSGPGEASPTAMARDWLLLVTCTAVHFYADGHLTFARSTKSRLSGALTLFASDAVAFRDLVVAADCGAEMHFSDGDGKGRQTQSWVEDGIVVSAKEYDSLHRLDITTKAALLQRSTFGYASSFVTGIDRISGTMTGDVADYYRGQDGRSDDEGYPYQRTVFEPSPLGRETKRGLPGQAFAIVQAERGGQLVDLNPHVSRIFYGCNGDTGATNLPVAQYSVVRHTDADGISTISVTDKRGRRVLSATGPVSSQGSHIVSRNFFDAAGRLVQLLSPAQFAHDATRRDEHAPQNRMAYDFLGNAVDRQTVDGGTSKAIYDRTGRLRFEVSNQGLHHEPNNLVVYTKYDVLGRVVEGGIVDVVWGDGKALREVAESNPDWPSSASGVAYRWVKRFAYDRCNPDPTDPFRCDYGLGMLARAECLDEDGRSIVSYDFRYDVHGNLLKQTATVSGPDSFRSDLHYRYDGSGSMIGVTYPDGFSISYDLNGLGQIAAVRDDQADCDIARYRFNAEGQLTKRILLSGEHTVTASLTHLPPGWPACIRHDSNGGTLLLEETLRYVEAAQAGRRTPGYHTGQIVQVAQRFGNWSPSRDYDYVFSTDGLGRLVSATHSSDPTQSVEHIGYDANGNIESIQSAGQSLCYDYDTGTNRISEVADSDGVVINDFSYDHKGQTTSSTARQLTSINYNEATGAVTGLTRNGERFGFLRDVDNHWVVRHHAGAKGAAKYSVIGPDGRRLWEVEDEECRRYIHGPDGLLAMDHGGRRYLHVSDYQGSTRIALVDGTPVAGFNYHPFGALLDEPFGNEETLRVIVNRFTGQRFDTGLGLYDFGARLYDPVLGRFLSRDNAGQFFSPYLYAGNAPHNYIDPDGNFVVSTFFAIVALAALLGGGTNAAFHASETKNAGDFFYYFGVGAGIGAATAIPVAGAVASTAAAAGGMTAAYAAAYEAAPKLMCGAIVATAAADAALTNGVNNVHEGNHFEDGMVTSVAIAVGTAVVFEAAAAGLSRFRETDLRGPGGGGGENRYEGRFPRTEPGEPKNAAGRTVLSGHGSLTSAAGEVKVPKGTSITFYGPPGSTLSNEAGQAVESGAAFRSPGRLRMVVREGRSSVRMSTEPVTYRSGELVPNYTLRPIKRSWLSTSKAANYRTVSRATELRTLLKPNMGKVDWAACESLEASASRMKIRINWSRT